MARWSRNWSLTKLPGRIVFRLSQKRQFLGWGRAKNNLIGEDTIIPCVTVNSNHCWQHTDPPFLFRFSSEPTDGPFSFTNLGVSLICARDKDGLSLAKLEQRRSRCGSS